MRTDPLTPAAIGGEAVTADDDRPAAIVTKYGMRWLPSQSTATIDVTRLWNDAGTAFLAVVVTDDTDRRVTHRVEIAVSQKGRSVRVWLDGIRMGRIFTNERTDSE